MKNLNLANLYTQSFRNNWASMAFSDYEGNNYKYSDVASNIKSLQHFYRSAGLKKGDKIVVLGRNSANWGTIFLSVISAGMVIVPILPDFNDSDTNHIINHSDSKIVFVAKSLLGKINFEKNENIQATIVLEDFSLHTSRVEGLEKILNESFSLTKEKGLDKNDFEFEPCDPDETCIISYTSGSTGFTKGVMIPERSLFSNIIFAQDNMPLKTGDKIVCFLPMAHVYGLLFEFLFPTTLGCHITFLNRMPTPDLLTKIFSEVQPHLILSVPLIIEKIYKKRILPTLQKPAIKILLAIPGISNILIKKIRSKLLATFGGRFFEIVIGGAPLNAEVEQFFRRIKFPFAMGYGMTECGPLISYAAWNKTMLTSAGKLVDRMEVRIDSEDPYNEVGEIQVRGTNVMNGYYKAPEITKEAFTEDGWLKTGDLGIIDKNNFIYIRGRSKNMILGASGQNIYPEEIESKISNLPYIAECVVTEKDGKLVALVFPDFDALKAENRAENELPQIMEENRKKINSELSKYEQIGKIELVKSEFEKTPKRNIKRFIYTQSVK